MSETQEYIIVEELKPGLKGINLKVRCAQKNEGREVVARNTGDTLRVTEAIVGDETGSILLTLWNDDIDKMEVDKIYALKNVYTTVFKTSLRLNIGRYGTMEEIDEDTPADVNTENNLSDKVYEQRPRFQSRPRFSGGGDRGGSYGGGGGGRRPYRDDRGGSRGGGRDRDQRRGPRRRY